MSVLLPNPKDLERQEDRVIAQRFVESLEKELKNKNTDELIQHLKDYVKKTVKDHPYLAGIIIGILLAKYTDIAKKI